MFPYDIMMGTETRDKVKPKFEEYRRVFKDRKININRKETEYLYCAREGREGW